MKLLILLSEEINRKGMVTFLMQDRDYNEEDANNEIDDILSWMEGLPKKLTLYRIIRADSEDEIDTENPGNHYSMDRKNLIANKGFSHGVGDRVFLLKVSVDKRYINKEDTLKNNIMYPNEKEVTLSKGGLGAKVVDITDITDLS